MAAYAAVTERIAIGSGVVNTWTRNVGLLAATFSTLDDLAPGRVMLGLGAWWEPLATKVGVAPRTTRSQAMRETVEATRRLLAMERVTYHGEFVHLDDVEIDIVHGDRSPKHVPIYIGATGMKMMELAGEIGDGVLLNYLVGPGYNRERDGGARRRRGARRPHASTTSTGRSSSSARSTTTASLALDRARELVAQYLGQQPHIMKASGVDESLLEEIGRGAHVAGDAGADRARDDARPRRGRPADHRLGHAGRVPREGAASTSTNGCTCPVLYPLGDDVPAMIDAFAVARVYGLRDRERRHRWPRRWNRPERRSSAGTTSRRSTGRSTRSRRRSPSRRS